MLYLLIFFIVKLALIKASPNYHLYFTDRTTSHKLRYDCLFYSITDNIVNYEEPFTFSRETIPYCISPETASTSWNDSIGLGTELSFEILRQQNISSQQLFDWSASMDVIEQYEIYLQNPYESLSTQTFYNCSTPWFGPVCQYKFSIPHTFAAIITAIFGAKKYVDRMQNTHTCYKILNCIREPSSSCLDWREICNGVIDCTNDGVDEKYCYELEMQECTENEYRCRNGQCIPSQFFHDNIINPDCLDQSDEKSSLQYPLMCDGDPSFRCEEIVCRNLFEFPCGDGTCSSEIMPSYYFVCNSGRDFRMTQAMLEHKYNSHIRVACWMALICHLKYNHIFPYINCGDICQDLDGSCTDIISQECPIHFIFPMSSITPSYIYFAYTNDRSSITDIPAPDYLCYDREICPFLPFSIMINNRTCHDFQKLNYIPYYNLPGINNQTEKNFFHGCISYGKMDNVKLCQNPALYRCMSSEKCISKHRLVDGIQDCFHGDDETYSSSCMLNHQHRFRCTSELNRCIAPINVGNFIWDCLGGEDEINKRGTDHHKSITFPMFCDGFFDMRFDRNAIETDETNCESWPCINQYTRCNGHSNCRNGADELNCGQTVCSLDTHPCVSPITNQLICIGLNKTGDGHIDCLGASDERYICRQSMSFKPTEQFNCWNHSMCLSSEALCDEQPNCLYGDDEQFCEKIYNPFDINTRCDSVWNGYRSASEEFLCSLTDEGKPETVYFALQNVTVQPLPNMISPIHTPFLVTKHQMSKRQNINFMDLVSYCNRGIVVYENETENKKCLCPPSYYGERCEYQTDRVSITMQIQSTELRTIYSIVLILVDDVGHIHSVEQHSYLSMRDCANKINTYLLYQHHHKELNGKSYFVHIHIFDKLTLKYRFSWSFPLLFLFLPVQRLAIQVIVPNREFKKIRNCPLKCFHGRCQQFLNNLTYFCQCDRHWSGPLCSIQSNCDCSDNSLCIGSIHNRSICICPLYKFGSYCYLTQSVCQPETCKNQGTCVPTDERISNTEFTCICKEGYTGLRCENIDMRLVISFSYDMIIPPSIFVHFITTFTNAYPQRTTTIKKIGFDQNSVILYRSDPFHMIFVQFSSNYYLLYTQNDNNNLKNYNQSVIILDSVSTSQRCPSIKDLLNTTIFSFSRFRFVKYYHLPCQERSTLNCFYDDIYLCLCNLDRHANCFEFEHNITYNCKGIDYCDNKAICLQNNPTCPDTVVCSCSECFHGSRCQFTTKGFELSLDTILGYHLHPNVAFIRQPPVVKVSIGLTMFILLAGLISNSLTIITFKVNKISNVGCDIYIPVLSINSIIIVIISTIKFWLLIALKMTFITNRMVLNTNCILIEFLCKALLSTTDWLNASIAIERAYSAIRGVYFKKKLSRQRAKWIVLMVYLVNFTSLIYDPFHRELIDDKEEQRTWCVVNYSKILQNFSTFINVFHFLSPFVINIISTITIIVVVTKRRSAAQKNNSFKEHLRQQLDQHRHLLINSCVLVILGSPRLIILFVTRCMKSAGEPWPFLAAYYISFIPSFLSFFVFVLSSKTYTQKFVNVIRRLQRKNRWLRR